MKEEVLKEFPDADVMLSSGIGGVFDVSLDGEMIFSKQGEGERFPDNGEIVELVQKQSSEMALY